MINKPVIRLHAICFLQREENPSSASEDIGGVVTAVCCVIGHALARSYPV